MELKIKKLVKPPSYYNPPTPRYATDQASGLDLSAAEDITIPPGATRRVATGICLEIPSGLEGQVRPRSGLSVRGLEVILGTIDSDYRGQVCVTVRNNCPSPWRIREGDRIAQLVIAPVVRVRPVVVPELSETERGERGFGSTGIRDLHVGPPMGTVIRGADLPDMGPELVGLPMPPAGLEEGET